MTAPNLCGGAVRPNSLSTVKPATGHYSAVTLVYGLAHCLLHHTRLIIAVIDVIRQISLFLYSYFFFLMFCTVFLCSVFCRATLCVSGSLLSTGVRPSVCLSRWCIVSTLLKIYLCRTGSPHHSSFF